MARTKLWRRIRRRGPSDGPYRIETGLEAPDILRTSLDK